MPASEFILGIESSCDDTSVVIATTAYEIISQATSTQLEHLEFGGVLPELASRLHMRNLMYLVETVLLKSKLRWQDISAIAVSINPGLIGSLLVGLSFSKSLAWGLGIPLITVNHMLGHVFANKIEHKDITPPYLALVVSGGHTELALFETDTEFTHLGKTLDDAAGETFDKIAKLLGLGYPGGPLIDKYATGNPDFYHFPRALQEKTDFNFSYSGLKTAVLQYLDKQLPGFVDNHLYDLAASVQAAIVEPLVKKTIRAAKLYKVRTILLGGGVAANSFLRKSLFDEAYKIKVRVCYPSLALCMDNAAMIAASAVHKLQNKQFAPLDINAFSDKGIRFL
jgi:N6-L-threonylcarbamoyladenine synthase